MTPQQQTVADAIVAIDSRVSYLDSSEALAWLSNATNEKDPVVTLTFGLNLVKDARREKLNTLIEALLADITFDQMNDLRDLLRAVLIDECRWQIREAIAEQRQSA
jgi:hypothetical protein